MNMYEYQQEYTNYRKHTFLYYLYYYYYQLLLVLSFLYFLCSKLLLRTCVCTCYMLATVPNFS